MNRYTKRTPIEDVIFDYTPYCYFSDGKRDKLAMAAFEREALYRLAAYEDIGLEPKEVKELAQAQADGRLVRLPCKVGDTIYVTEPRFYNYALHTGVQRGKVCGFEREYVGRRREWIIWVRLDDDSQHCGNAYPFADIGKTVFFTREEAEKALKGLKND